MKRIFRFSLYTTLCLSVIPLNLMAQKRPSQNVKSRVNFVYCDPTAADYATCVENNKVRQDSPNDYVDGVDNVSAVFNLDSGSNDLTVNLNSSSRTSILDLFDVIYGNPPTWHRYPQNVKWHINVRQAYLAKGYCGTTPCSMPTVMGSTITKVSGASASYNLGWNPNSIRPINSNDYDPPSPYNTSPVTVVYDKVDGVETWTVTPDKQDIYVNSTLKNVPVAGLADISNKGGPAGQYIVPFTLIARPKSF